jgi:putative ABC transport system permease protein
MFSKPSFASSLWQDLVLGVRQLRKAPGFSSLSILTLAVGIGACTVMFSVVHSVLLRPLDYPDPERLVIVCETNLKDGSVTEATPGAYLEWSRQATVFDGIAMTMGRGYRLKLDQGFRGLGGAAVSANFFDVVGIHPILGRTFLKLEGQPGNSGVVVLNESLWRQQFAAREDIIGQVLQMNGQPYTVVGVVPDQPRGSAPLFTPLVFTSQNREDFGTHDFWPMARLKSGVTLAQARTEMATIAARIAEQRPATNRGFGATVTNPLSLMTQGVRPQLLTLLGAVILLLLIACVNVANLMLARANGRQRELALRSTLGASRQRILQMLLCESLLLCGAAGILGCLLAVASVRIVAGFASAFVPRAHEISFDGSVLGAASGVVIIMGLALGAFVALLSTRGINSSVLKESDRASGSRTRRRLRGSLVVFEISLALILLAGAGLLLRTLYAMQRFDLGFSAKNVYIRRFDLNAAGRYNSPEKIDSFVRNAVERLRQLPEISHAAFATAIPTIQDMDEYFVLPGQSTATLEQLGLASWNAVSPDYFRLMGIPVLRGRGINTGDRSGAPRVALINQTMAAQCFPNKDPVGQRLMVMTMSNRPDVWREIIGVVGDIRTDGPMQGVKPQVYEPIAQEPIPSSNPLAPLSLLVESAGPAPTLSADVRAAFQELDPDLGIGGVASLQSNISQSWISQQFSLNLFLVFAGIAVLLATVGIYGMMAYSVSQRTHEIGIRLALGATPRQIVWLILGSSAGLVALGLAIGTVGAWMSGRMLAAFLFGTSPHDPATFAAIYALMTAAALAASWLPARRAASIDPATALRYE